MTTAPIYLTEADVGRLVTVKDAIATLEELFATWGQPSTVNLPRQRARLPGGAFNLMGAAYGAKGVYGLKAYAGMKGAHFHTLLYSSARRQAEGHDRGRSVRPDAHGGGERARDQADGQSGRAHARRHRHRPAVTHAGRGGLRGTADQAHQGLRPHAGAPRGLCARARKGPWRGDAPGGVGGSLCCGRQCRDHHHQVGRAGLPGRVARAVAPMSMRRAPIPAIGARSMARWCCAPR